MLARIRASWIPLSQSSSARTWSLPNRARDCTNYRDVQPQSGPRIDPKPRHAFQSRRIGQPAHLADNVVGWRGSCSRQLRGADRLANMPLPVFRNMDRETDCGRLQAPPSDLAHVTEMRGAQSPHQFLIPR